MMPVRRQCTCKTKANTRHEWGTYVRRYRNQTTCPRPHPHLLQLQLPGVRVRPRRLRHILGAELVDEEAAAVAVRQAQPALGRTHEHEGLWARVRHAVGAGGRAGG